MLDLYLPMAHSVHISPLLPANPALHKQASADTLPAKEVVFPGQSLHAALPVVVLYFPAGHSAHAEPSAPVEPALHLQSIMWLLPSVELLFVGHS